MCKQDKNKINNDNGHVTQPNSKLQCECIREEKKLEHVNLVSIEHPDEKKQERGK